MKTSDSPLLQWMTFLTSASTLVCCALPALLVSLGLGAAMAGLVGAVPQIVWFSQNKGLVFGFSGIMLTIAGIAQWRSRNAPCPIDPELAKKCTSARRWSVRIYLISLGLFATGVFFAFVAPWLNA